MQAFLDFLNSLPTLPVSPEMALIISVLLVSFTTATIVLIRNMRQINTDLEGEADMGVIFENPSSLMPHVIELRKRAINSIIGIVLATVVGMTITTPVIEVLAEPVGGLDRLIAIGVTEPFAITFKIALALGLILASPYVLSQVWIFIAAGLKKDEKRIFYWLFPFGTILLLTGIAFAYYAMLPVAVPFLVGFGGFKATPTIENYIKFVTNALLGVGIAFELPLVMFLLAKAGIVNSRMLAKNWRIALVIITVLSAIITPTPDPINMGIVAAPLMVLYLISIVLAALARSRSE